MFQKNTIETRRVSKILGRLIHDVFLICKTEGQDFELVDSAYDAVRRIDLAAFNHRADRATPQDTRILETALVASIDFVDVAPIDDDDAEIEQARITRNTELLKKIIQVVKEASAT